MIGSKVVLTYKRKRPGLGFGPDQTHGSQTLELLKAPANKQQVSTHDSERKDAKTLNQCALYNGGGGNTLQKSEYCHSSEDLDGKKLCSRCVKQQDTLSTLQKVGNSCEDTMKVKKPGFPLITFSRRVKQKKTTDETVVQEKSTFVEKYDLVAVKSNNSTMDNGCLVDVSTDLTGYDSNSRYCTASQEKKTIEDVDICDAASLSEPKIEIEKSTNEEFTTASCILKDTPPIADSSGKSQMDADRSLEVSQSLVFAKDESRVISGDDVESAKTTVHKKRDEGSLASFDLTKPPPESSGFVDCNLALESSSNVQLHNDVSENHRESTDSTSRSHPVVLHEFPSRSRVLDLLDDRIGETSLSQLHCVPPTLSSSSHPWGPDLPSSSIGQSQTSKQNFLQLFPEDNILPSNRKPLHFRSSTCSAPFRSLESRNFEDMIGSQYPSDSLSLIRHKIMLDNILSKARAVNVRKGKFVDGFDHPNVWSEEELDFLWIGVRRHGIGSWDAILRDPRLHFSSWRSPRELAERWEEEESNLLRAKPPKPAKKHSPIEEPQLSLGFRGRSTVDPDLVNVPKGNLNLPPWLPCSRPVEKTGVPWVSYTGQSGLMQWINQPFCGSNRGQPTSGAAYWAEALAPARPVSKANEVIVIESDVSSEETVSDDHSVRS
ncbi:uncharacterized protein LOC143615075 [Bidens hawaiensis]|uniref:uncharacterized protein LOC143615075 n=1 Tax=Bidens hawaiensis TaxID=980011 RepID=UPI0040497A68